MWSLVRRFDQPQKYKPFVSRCVVKGDFGIGSVREVNVKSGLPATTSTERLELLDDNEHILGVKIVGGDHRLRVWFFSNTFFFFLVTVVHFLHSLACLSMNYNCVMCRVTRVSFARRYGLGECKV